MASEIEAMGAIDQALNDLETDERKRVLRWAIDKFGAGQVDQSGGGSGDLAKEDGGGGNGQHSAQEGGTSRYERIVDLVDAAAPKTVVDHVLVASYWFQIVRGQENFTGQEVNAELKDLGHGSKNITDSYTSLISRKPPAARQVQKSGSSRQARKRYRLTEVGIRGVERMLQGEEE
jgi:hypothetical protein